MAVLDDVNVRENHEALLHHAVKDREIRFQLSSVSTTDSIIACLNRLLARTRERIAAAVENLRVTPEVRN